MYSDALKGESTAVSMTDRFKKINYKRNSNQQQYSQFSVHLEDIERTFHKTEWSGRDYIGNISYPKGHKYPKGVELNKILEEEPAELPKIKKNYH